MDFIWDEAKSERNHVERDLPFGLARELFAGPVVEQVDARRNYGEIRMKAIGVVGGLLMACVFTDRGAAHRIISLRYASRRERNAYRAAYPS
ncbi:MAG TPA: BrnT family toxin [Acetobacteraceae bacterium]|jgi:uncharacterized DUF497 family protein|nr:BrnT family toxin [Acetobacteraceae bacterium]